MKITRIAALFFTCFLPPLANATLITQDLITAGDNLATYDDNTGNLWIKSAYTKNMTYGQVLDLINNTSSLSGFELAYDTQINSLMNDYAMPPGGKGIPSTFAGASIFYDALVSPNPVPALTGAGAWNLRGNGLARQVDPDSGNGFFSYYQVFISDSASPATWTDYGTSDLIPKGDPLTVGGPGFFLVKHETDIPEPGSLVLLAAGLIGIIAANRRQVLFR